jgi:anti-sigma factor RsiW
MAEDTKQFDKETDETIRHFLLGWLEDDERVIFEEHLFRDEGFEQRVRLAELELADDYAFQRLSPQERERFETAFPVSVARRQQLSVSKALRDSSFLSAAPEAASGAETRVSARETLLRMFGFNRPALGYAIGFGALLLFAVIVWVVVRERRSNQSQITRHQPTPVATREFAHPTASLPPLSTVSPQPTVKTRPTPDVSSSLPLVATFVLLPGTLRESGGTTRIAVPQAEPGIVRLQLKLDADEPGAYVAELLTAEGQTLSTVRNLKPNQSDSISRVALDVPTRLLKSGDYQVKLSRTVDGSTAGAGLYYFRVTK